ncbi:MAG: UbiA family prenyltransferase [Tabrizicola sp.]|nr:UbiA family prenyltransferase [Tabrizicola sp.]
MLIESFANVMHHAPLSLWAVPVWLAHGKAALKQELARRSRIAVETLPFDPEVLALIAEAKEQGRRVVLCTATDRDLAEAIARHLQVFDEVLASDGTLNLASGSKAAELVRRYGRRGFDYAGNAHADLAVWQDAGRAIVVSGSKDLIAEAGKVCEVARVITPPQPGLKTLAKGLRVHQWLKNVLLFVPLLASHRIGSPDLWVDLILAFVAFSLCASMVYILNDLIDLDSDRRHPRKSKRVFASGELSILTGIILAIALGMLSLGLALSIGLPFTLALLLYFVLTSAYSFALKRVLLVDCIVLAGLYTLRIVAGAQAIFQPMSLWLLGFSFFLFLSLSYVKRFTEVSSMARSADATTPDQKIAGRGYLVSDAPILGLLGVGAGYASAVILANYLNSETVRLLYAEPGLLAGLVPILLFWISWVWLKASRGEMQDDPVIFAVKDRVSQLAGVAFALVVLVGARGLPW